MSEKVCAIVGYGPGLGAAYADVFKKAGYELALLNRSGSAPASDAKTYACDAGDPGSLTQSIQTAEADLGEIDVLIYNADLAQFGGMDEISVDQFEQSWRVGTLGLFAAVKHLGPRMATRGSGCIIVSGATASLRGNLWTTAFAPSKAAQRILAQSLAN